MPRPLRAFFDGFFHLAVHASDTRRLFITEEDRTSFLKLSRAMQDLHTSYSRLHNRLHSRSAHLSAPSSPRAKSPATSS